MTYLFGFSLLSRLSFDFKKLFNIFLVLALTAFAFANTFEVVFKIGWSYCKKAYEQMKTSVLFYWYSLVYIVLYMVVMRRKTSD